MNGCFQRTTTVDASGASIPSMRSNVALPGTPRSLSCSTRAPKRKSSAVTGVPSCQRAVDLIFQVVSMRPSGKRRHKPLSTVGTASASCGCSTPWSSAWVIPAWVSSSIASRPGMLPTVFMVFCWLRAAGVPRMAAIMRFGTDWAADELPLVGCCAPGVLQAVRRTVNAAMIAGRQALIHGLRCAASSPIRISA